MKEKETGQESQQDRKQVEKNEGKVERNRQKK